MDYFLEFHWWYLILAVIAFFVIFGKGKGGVVVERLTADLEVLDEQFQHCKIEADYTTFKEGEPHHIDIEIERLPENLDAEFGIYLNDKLLSKPEIKRKRKIEFDHWSDEEIDFPNVAEGDELVIKYHGRDILKGVFRSN